MEEREKEGLVSRWCFSAPEAVLLGTRSRHLPLGQSAGRLWVLEWDEEAR